VFTFDGLLGERFAEESKIELKTRLASGEFELVDAGQPSLIDPDDPNGLIGMRKQGPGEGQVQQVVLYPTDAPELYALRTKIQWLQRRIDTLGEN